MYQKRKNKFCAKLPFGDKLTKNKNLLAHFIGEKVFKVWLKLIT